MGASCYLEYPWTSFGRLIPAKDARGNVVSESLCALGAGCREEIEPSTQPLPPTVELFFGYLRVIDIPGHERVRFKFFDQYKAIARGIIFVIDATTIQKEIRDAAELLYTILTDAAIVSAAPRVLVLCNKQDQTLAKGSQVVKSLLEKELNLLRSTKASQLSSIEGSTAQVTLGTPDKEFQFAQLAPISVEFAEGCAFNSTPETQAELKSVHKWVASIA
ncbi:hypothetical protein J6590_061473 [Homalodisca vitripennis]|nr:hypothetical protein J6590_061473 [Homalodisca vitripennis]